MAKDKSVIIKKIKKVSAAGHHGGSWKIAYADFVTAMMAFFLLMWLLNATTEEQKRGISNYFDPSSVGDMSGGSTGVMGGLAMTDDKSSFSGTAGYDATAGAVSHKPSTPGKKVSGEDSLHESTNSLEELIDEVSQTPQDEQTALMEKTEKDIIDAMNKKENLAGMLKNLLFEQTEEGLRIQILDAQPYPMFPSGSSEMYPVMEEVLQTVASVIQKYPNKLSITGHTDAVPYAKTSQYTNWELSSDRAHASRRVLEHAGINTDRFDLVVGKAAKELLLPKDPMSARNRRISITLLKQKPKKKIADKIAADIAKNVINKKN